MKKVLIILFILLYACVGFVSVYHAIEFFKISNNEFLSIILSCTFEIGQAAVLFSLLTDDNKRIMPWILMFVLTIVQIIGNVFASYKYMIINNLEEIEYFTNSVLFFLKNPNPQYNQVMISYITGAILPLVALCMTGMIVGLTKRKENIINDDVKDINVENVTNEEEDKIII